MENETNEVVVETYTTADLVKEAAIKAVAGVIIGFAANLILESVAKKVKEKRQVNKLAKQTKLAIVENAE
jgi:hypothetical protein